MTSQNTAAIHIAILMFDNCDLLDTGGPYEVFLTASRLAQRSGTSQAFVVDTITPTGEPVNAYGGLGLIPTATPQQLDTADVIIVPGAVDLDAALADKTLKDLLLHVRKRGEQHSNTIIASVCTGAFLLAEVGALDSKQWTTHWEDIDLLSQRLPEGAQRGVRWVDQGQIVTAGALSSGIAMSLHLVSRLAGVALAKQTATQLDYEWNNISLVGEK